LGQSYGLVWGRSNAVTAGGVPMKAVTQDVGTSQLGQGCAAQSCLVEVTAFIGTPPAVTAFDLPQTSPYD